MDMQLLYFLKIFYLRQVPPQRLFYENGCKPNPKLGGGGLECHQESGAFLENEGNTLFLCIPLSSEGPQIPQNQNVD